VQFTAAYSFKGLSQIIKLMAELGTLRVRGKRRNDEMPRFLIFRFGI
jgi:hypothetical protein